MEVKERIDRYVERLPKKYQEEILDFVRYLFNKEEGKASRREEELAWSRGSLTLAMRGMEDEDSPEYSDADLKEVFPRSAGCDIR